MVATFSVPHFDYLGLNGGAEIFRDLLTGLPSVRKSWRAAISYRAQLAFPGNAFVPLVQMSDLIFGLAILALRKKSNNLVVAARVLTTHVWGWRDLPRREPNRT